MSNAEIETLTLLDADTGRDSLEIRVHSEGGILCIAFSSDQRLIATGDYGGMLTLYDAENGSRVHVFRGHTNAVSDLAFSPDCRRLASAGSGEVIKLWTSRPAKELMSFEEGAGRVKFSPDGNYLVSSSYDGVNLRSTR